MSISQLFILVSIAMRKSLVNDVINALHFVFVASHCFTLHFFNDIFTRLVKVGFLFKCGFDLSLNIKFCLNYL